MTLNRSLAELVNEYRKLDKIGEGTYGVVYKAINTMTNKLVALKKIRLEREDGVPPTTIREISLLKKLDHPNIVKLSDVILKIERMYLVFEYIDMDLQDYMLQLDKPMDQEQIRNFLYQMLQGLIYCHIWRMLHRDLKPQNMLVNKEGTILKLADFGLGRVYGIPKKLLTHEVVTLWYRSPEVILGMNRYNCSVDMWSIGCIFSEMCMGDPLFNGDSEIDQLFKIFQIMGTPNHIAKYTKLAAWKNTFPIWPHNSLESKTKTAMSQSAITLLKKMLDYDEVLRISCKDALLDPYFSDFNYNSVPAFGAERNEFHLSFLPVTE